MQQKAKEKQTRRGYRAVTRSGDDQPSNQDDISLKLATPKKNLEPYAQVFAQNTAFFSSYSPDYIEEVLVNHFNENKNDIFKMD